MERRAILAIGLSILVFIIFQYWQQNKTKVESSNKKTASIELPQKEDAAVTTEPERIAALQNRAPEGGNKVLQAAESNGRGIPDSPLANSGTEALNTIVSMTMPALKSALDSKSLPGTGDRILDALVRAAALERAGDIQGAIEAYRDTGKMARSTPYAVSAGYRLRYLEVSEDPEKLESFYETVAKEQELQGWFIISGKWVWDTTRRAAWQGLVELKSDYLSYRLFLLLRSKSIFRPEYGYLFMLCVIAFGAKIIMLPLLIKSSRLGIKIQALAPKVAVLQAVHRSDPAALNREIAALYRANGVNALGGCLPQLVVDLIFVVWAFVTLHSFSPQLALDNSQFFWITNIMERDFRILLLWIAASVLIPLLSPIKIRGSGVQSTGMLIVGSLIFSGALAGIAWFWHWPAYVFIFWTILTLMGWLIQLPIVLSLKK